MIEQRSIVLTVLILAIVLAGGSFYFFVLKPRVEPSELATSVGQLALEGDEEKEGVASEVPLETPVEATVGAAGETSTLLPAPAVAGVEEGENVAPTAKTGAGPLLALAAASAIIVGSWELVLMIRSHGSAPEK